LIKQNFKLMGKSIKTPDKRDALQDEKVKVLIKHK
ncbi:hypothetical protein AC249_AIPGENE18242, partial [Exaiptasia diaphana]